MMDKDNNHLAKPCNQEPIDNEANIGKDKNFSHVKV